MKIEFFLEIYYYNSQEINAKGFFIISQDGISLASSRDSNVGSRNLITERQPELMARVFAGESVCSTDLLRC